MRSPNWILPACLMLACSPTRWGLKRLDRHAHRRGLEHAELDTGDLHIRYHDGGEGTPLLMLHGFGGDGLSTWAPQLGAFHRAHRLIIPDLLWFGDSHGGTPNLETQAQSVLALLDHLGLDEVDVMGVSYGGFVTLELWRQAPERIRRVVIQDSPGPTFTDVELTAMLARFDVTDPADIFIANDGDDVRRMLDLTFYRDRRLPGWLLDDMHREVFSKNQPQQRALLADLPARREDVQGLDLSTFPPTLLVWGEHDPVFPLSTGEALAEMLGGQLHVIEDTAHGPSAERAREYNRVVLDFLADG